MRLRFLTQITFNNLFAGTTYDAASDSINFGNLTYAELLQKITLHYQATDANFRQDFLKQISAILKQIPNGALNGLDKNSIDADLANLAVIGN